MLNGEDHKRQKVTPGPVTLQLIFLLLPPPLPTPVVKATAKHRRRPTTLSHPLSTWSQSVIALSVRAHVGNTPLSYHKLRTIFGTRCSSSEALSESHPGDFSPNYQFWAPLPCQAAFWKHQLPSPTSTADPWGPWANANKAVGLLQSCQGRGCGGLFSFCLPGGSWTPSQG